MASPRISFSGDLLLTSASDGRLPTAEPDSAGPSDFDFGVAPGASESFLADHLFSHGVLLPGLPVLAPKDDDDDAPPPVMPSSKKTCGAPQHVVSAANSTGHRKGENARACKRSSSSSSLRSLWPFGRSCSLNVDDRRKPGVGSSRLRRSKSAEEPHCEKQNHAGEGSSRGYHNAKSSGLMKRKNGASPERLISGDAKAARRYYYSGGSRRSYDDGVRIGLILNIPSTSGILKAFSSLFTCGCGDKRTSSQR